MTKQHDGGEAHPDAGSDDEPRVGNGSIDRRMVVASIAALAGGRTVRAVPAPESEWPETFRANGFSPAAIDAFCEMYRGFNSGLVSFSGDGETVSGTHALKDVLARVPTG